MEYIDIVKIYKDFLNSRDADDDVFCMRVRKVLEAMVENIVVKNRITFDKNTSLFDKIELFEKEKLINQESVRNYHYIRKQTNPNIHVGNDIIPKQEKLQIERYIEEEIEKYGKYILNETKKIQLQVSMNSTTAYRENKIVRDKEISPMEEFSFMTYDFDSNKKSKTKSILPQVLITRAEQRASQVRNQTFKKVFISVGLVIGVVAILMSPTILESIKEKKVQQLEQEQQETQEETAQRLEQNQQILKDNQDSLFFEEAILNYIPNELNQITIRIAEEAKPGASVWCTDGNGTTYTSDNSIVSINSAGIITGINEGSAYIVIRGLGDMHQVYKIKVVKNYWGISYLEQFANKL